MDNGSRKKSGVGGQGGFTLLEVIITVAIVAILAAIAYASYEGQITKSRRAAGAGCLQERAQFMERYYTTHLTYDDDDDPLVIQDCDTEVSPHYEVGLVDGSLTASTFTLQAVPQGAQETRDTLCGTLTINQQGVRDESGTASDATECW